MILDGHVAHYPVELLEFAQAHWIAILVYPGHCTHALQPHDVVIFAALKQRYADSVEQFERTTDETVTKYNFLAVLERPFRETFTERNILKSFSKTGIWPVNASVITAEQMAPSLPTSVKNATFPIQLSSPAKAVSAAFDLDQEEYRTIDPALLQTPIRKAQIARRLLRGTSGAHIASDSPFRPGTAVDSPVIQRPIFPAPITSAYAHILDPSNASRPTFDQLLTENEILRSGWDREAKARTGDIAQMIIQNRLLKKQSKQINAKARKSKPNKTKLFPGGKGRLVTTDEFKDEMVARQAARDAKQVEAAEKKQNRKNKANQADNAKKGGEATTRRVGGKGGRMEGYLCAATQNRDQGEGLTKKTTIPIPKRCTGAPNHG